MMHELVHSWFGNLVSPANWADLWLNEGHADFYGLLYRYERGWTDSLGLTTMEARMKDTYARGDQWRHDSGPVAAPNEANLFDSQRYLGGVLVLYALRQAVGEDVFTRIEQHLPRPLPQLLGDDGELHRRRLGGLRPGPVRLPRGLAVRHEDAADARSPGLDGHAGESALASPHSRRGGHYHDNSATL